MNGLVPDIWHFINFSNNNSNIYYVGLQENIKYLHMSPYSKPSNYYFHIVSIISICINYNVSVQVARMPPIFILKVNSKNCSILIHHLTSPILFGPSGP